MQYDKLIILAVHVSYHEKKIFYNCYPKSLSRSLTPDC